MSRSIPIACLALCLAAAGHAAAQPAPPHLPDDLSPAAVAAADDFLWLEAMRGERVQAFVDAANAEVARELEGDPRFETFRREAYAVLSAGDRVPSPRFEAGGVSVFWQDAQHPKGQWRRASLDAFRAPDTAWETVLDLDALAAEAGRDWVWKGADCLPPDARRCLVHLSIGGQDAVEVREYDAIERRFVAGGFHLPEGKQRTAWLDADTILVAADFGPGSLTESGYPHSVRALSRGQRPEEAPERFRGSAGDGGYGVTPSVFRGPDGAVEAVVFHRPLDTYRSLSAQWREGGAVPLALPERVDLHGVLDGRLVFTANAPWRLGAHEVPRGALVAADLAVLRGEAPPPEASPVVFAPGPREAVAAVAITRTRVVVSLLDNVNGALRSFAPDDDAGGWRAQAFEVPGNAAITLVHATRAHDRVFHLAQGFLLPPTLLLADAGSGEAEVLRRSPPRFDASTHRVEQREAVSRDGTRVPYFLVAPRDAPADGSTPTILFGYGGGNIPILPQYAGQLGALWLSRGGAYALANIRGGGEFGPGWHQAAIQSHRQRAFDDFAAVAQDLVDSGATSPRRLGIYGRSNGGVLTSVSITQRPGLFRAAVIESPVIDMLRYTELSAGASWAGEYGDPRKPEDAAYLARYSAYQQVRPDAGYPRVYITTNLLDDRVHPGHARKFAARLARYGYAPLYFEDASGGHSYDADPAANARRWARHYVYFSQRLMD